MSEESSKLFRVGKAPFVMLPKLDSILLIQMFSALEVKNDFCHAAEWNTAVCV